MSNALKFSIERGLYVEKQAPAKRQPKDVSQLTRTEIESARESAGKRVIAACDALIAAGRGHERPSDMRQKSDALSMAWCAASDRYREVNAECERRMTHHGTHQRIKA